MWIFKNGLFLFISHENASVVYATDIRKSRMVIPDLMEFLMYKNNGKFFRNFCDFIKEEQHCRKMTKVYMIYNLDHEKTIDDKVKKYDKGHINCRLLTEYQFTYWILTDNECWLIVITKEMEAVVRKLKNELKVILRFSIWF